MGLFSRKKKLSEEEKNKLEKAREELQKSKDKQNQSDQEDFNTLEKNRKQELEIKKPNKMDEFHAKVEAELKQKQEDFNDGVIQNSNSLKEPLENIEQSTCSVPDCQKEVNFFSGKKCKFCHKKFCFEHIQLEKHECIKTTPTKYLRKTWLRRYNLNISSGRFIVVCDDCGYVSGYGSLIDIAGDERKSHIENNSCNSKLVFLEEDLSEEKIEKNIDLEKVVPSDRDFWVCSHCRPAQKFIDRSAYIAHHFSHG